MGQSFKYTPNAFGGTEYMGRGWHKYIAASVPKFDNYLSLIIPGVTPQFNEIFTSDKSIIIWMHNTPQQFDPDKLAVLKDPRLLDKVKYFVVPSEEHKRLTLLELPIEPERIYVIHNAIEPLIYDPTKFDSPKQIKLIHTSSADRGLDVLLHAISMVKEDFRLEVYNNFNPDLEQNMPKFDKRIRFYARTPKDTVREAYENAHIHAYPSTYPETFCISQVEAMSAGLLCVTSDLGAIPEVSGSHTTMYPYTENKFEHAKTFAAHLTKAIKDIKDGNWDPSAQIEFVNNTFSWEATRNKWLEFHELI